MSNLITTQINNLAVRFDLPQSEELYSVLKATAFKGDVSDAQLSALLIVANQYGLNPWTKEIYAFPDKKNGIIPVVSVDGWARIINTNQAFDGMEFRFSEDMVTMDGAGSPAPAWTECVIYRKDRTHPTIIREYLDEIYRAPFKPKDGGYTVAGPWQSHPKRFSRHKAMIQCARMAFGFGGIYDDDEAARISENTPPPMKQIDPETGEIKPAAPKEWPDDAFEKQLPKCLEAIAKGKTVADLIAWLETKGKLTDAQKAKLTPAKAEVEDAAPKVTYAQVADKLHEAKNEDQLNESASLIDAVADPAQRKELSAVYDICLAALRN